MSSAETSVAEEIEWQRLSPISIIYFIVKFTIKSVKQWFLNMVPAIAAFTVFVDNKLFWFSIIVPSLVLLIVIFSFFYYWYFKFQARDGEILINRGVFSKERLNLQYTRVQNVNIGTPFYFAPFKLVNCIIESAGSKSTEVNLPGVGEAFALSMRSEVFAVEKKEELEEEEGEAAKEVGTSKPILKLSNRESAKYGLTSYFAFIVLAALAPFMDRIISFVSDNIFPALMDIVEPVVGSEIVSWILIVFTSVLLVFLLITSASVAGAFIRFYNFELYNNEDKLVRVAGLLERKSTTLTKIKVQSVQVKQNLMAKVLNRVSLQYRQVGAMQAAGGMQGKGDDSSIQIPMLIPTEAKKYTSAVFENCPEPEFSKIHSSYVARVFFYFWVLPLVIILSVPVLFLSKFFLLPLIILVPIFVLLKLRYRRFGFWFNEEFGAIREGLIGQKIVIFPLYKVQVTRVRQSRGQRKRKVGNLQVQLGSGGVSIPYLPIEQINKFVNLALYKTESSSKTWM